MHLSAKKRNLKNGNGVVKQSVFDNVKTALTSTEVLKYYDVNKPVRLIVYTSTKGLCAVIL